MHRRYDKKHIFLAIGACIVLFSPVYLLIIPLAVVNTLYYKKGIWITYAPTENYVTFGVSLFLIVLACLVLGFLGIRKWTVGAGVFCVLLSSLVFYIASLSYITLSGEEISYRTLFSKEKQSYSWEDIEKLVYYVKLPEDDELSYYEFYFKDGQMMKMKQNSYVTNLQGNLNGTVRAMQIPLQYVEENGIE